MLNEIIEYTAYIGKPQSDNPRVQPKALTNNFKKEDRGYILKELDQILLVIARGVIYSFEDGAVKGELDCDLNNGVAITMEILSHWLGINKEDTFCHELVSKWFEENTDADCWLEKFWTYHYKIIKKANESEALNEWNECLEKYKNILEGADYRSESLSFKNIIASAIEAGELTERYMIVKKSDMPDERVSNGNNNIKKAMKRFEYLYDYSGSPQATTKMKLLKNIAAFLIWQNEHPDKQTEVLLKRIRLFGWYGLDDSSGKADKWCLKDFSWNSNPIMLRQRYKDFAKMGIAEEYIKNFGFQLIYPSEIEAYKENYWILKDPGYGLNKPFIVING